MCTKYEEEQSYCAACNGSGEGMYDGSSCRICGGSGVEPYEKDPDDFDEPDTYEGDKP